MASARNTPSSRIDIAAIDRVVASIDDKLERQLDEIWRHTAFSQLEELWRAVWFVVERVDDVYVHVALLQCSKQEARADLAEAESAVGNSLYALCDGERRRGPSPIGVLIASFELERDEDDLKLLEGFANVASNLCAQFIGNVGPAFFGLSGWDALPYSAELPALLEEPRYDSFRALCARDVARSATLCMPRFSLPSSEQPPAQPDGDHGAWQSDGGIAPCYAPASFAMAARLAESYARHGWCANISGVPFGAVSLAGAGREQRGRQS